MKGALGWTLAAAVLLLAVLASAEMHEMNEMHNMHGRAEVADGGIVVVVFIILGLVIGSCCIIFYCFLCMGILVFVILSILGVDVFALLGTVFYCVYKKEKAQRNTAESYGASEYGQA